MVAAELCIETVECAIQQLHPAAERDAGVFVSNIVNVCRTIANSEAFFAELEIPQNFGNVHVAIASTLQAALSRLLVGLCNAIESADMSQILTVDSDLVVADALALVALLVFQPRCEKAHRVAASGLSAALDAGLPDRTLLAWSTTCNVVLNAQHTNDSVSIRRLCEHIALTPNCANGQWSSIVNPVTLMVAPQRIVGRVKGVMPLSDAEVESALLRLTAISMCSRSRQSVIVEACGRFYSELGRLGAVLPLMASQPYLLSIATRVMCLLAADQGRLFDSDPAIGELFRVLVQQLCDGASVSGDVAIPRPHTWRSRGTVFWNCMIVLYNTAITTGHQLNGADAARVLAVKRYLHTRKAPLLLECLTMADAFRDGKVLESDVSVLVRDKLIALLGVWKEALHVREESSAVAASTDGQTVGSKEEHLPAQQLEDCDAGHLHRSTEPIESTFNRSSMATVLSSFSLLTAVIRDGGSHRNASALLLLTHGATDSGVEHTSVLSSALGVLRQAAFPPRFAFLLCTALVGILEVALHQSPRDMAPHLHEQHSLPVLLTCVLRLFDDDAAAARANQAAHEVATRIEVMQLAAQLQTFIVDALELSQSLRDSVLGCPTTTEAITLVSVRWQQALVSGDVHEEKHIVAAAETKPFSEVQQLLRKCLSEPFVSCELQRLLKEAATKSSSIVSPNRCDPAVNKDQRCRAHMLFVWSCTLLLHDAHGLSETMGSFVTEELRRVYQAFSPSSPERHHLAKELVDTLHRFDEKGPFLQELTLLLRHHMDPSSVHRSLVNHGVATTDTWNGVLDEALSKDPCGCCAVTSSSEAMLSVYREAQARGDHAWCRTATQGVLEAFHAAVCGGQLTCATPAAIHWMTLLQQLRCTSGDVPLLSRSASVTALLLHDLRLRLHDEVSMGVVGAALRWTTVVWGGILRESIREHEAGRSPANACGEALCEWLTNAEIVVLFRCELIAAYDSWHRMPHVLQLELLRLHLMLQRGLSHLYRISCACGSALWKEVMTRAHRVLRESIALFFTSSVRQCTTFVPTTTTDAGLTLQELVLQSTEFLSESEIVKFWAAILREEIFFVTVKQPFYEVAWLYRALSCVVHADVSSSPSGDDARVCGDDGSVAISPKLTVLGFRMVDEALDAYLALANATECCAGEDQWVRKLVVAETLFVMIRGVLPRPKSAKGDVSLLPRRNYGAIAKSAEATETIVDPLLEMLGKYDDYAADAFFERARQKLFTILADFSDEVCRLTEAQRTAYSGVLSRCSALLRDIIQQLVFVSDANIIPCVDALSALPSPHASNDNLPLALVLDWDSQVPPHPTAVKPSWDLPCPVDLVQEILDIPTTAAVATVKTFDALCCAILNLAYEECAAVYYRHLSATIIEELAMEETCGDIGGVVYRVSDSVRSTIETKAKCILDSAELVDFVAFSAELLSRIGSQEFQRFSQSFAHDGFVSVQFTVPKPKPHSAALAEEPPPGKRKAGAGTTRAPKVTSSKRTHHSSHHHHQQQQSVSSFAKPSSDAGPPVAVPAETGTMSTQSKVFIGLKRDRDKHATGVARESSLVRLAELLVRRGAEHYGPLIAVVLRCDPRNALPHPSTARCLLSECFLVAPTSTGKVSAMRKGFLLEVMQKELKHFSANIISTLLTECARELEATGFSSAASQPEARSEELVRALEPLGALFTYIARMDHRAIAVALKKKDSAGQRNLHRVVQHLGRALTEGAWKPRLHSHGDEDAYSTILFLLYLQAVSLSRLACGARRIRVGGAVIRMDRYGITDDRASFADGSDLSDDESHDDDGDDGNGDGDANRAPRVWAQRPPFRAVERRSDAESDDSSGEWALHRRHPSHAIFGNSSSDDDNDPDRDMITWEGDEDVNDDGNHGSDSESADSSDVDALFAGRRTQLRSTGSEFAARKTIMTDVAQVAAALAQPSSKEGTAAHRILLPHIPSEWALMVAYVPLSENTGALLRYYSPSTLKFRYTFDDWLWTENRDTVTSDVSDRANVWRRMFAPFALLRSNRVHRLLYAIVHGMCTTDSDVMNVGAALMETATRWPQTRHLVLRLLYSVVDGCSSLSHATPGRDPQNVPPRDIKRVQFLEAMIQFLLHPTASVLSQRTLTYLLSSTYFPDENDDNEEGEVASDDDDDGDGDEDPDVVSGGAQAPSSSTNDSDEWVEADGDSDMEVDAAEPRPGDLDEEAVLSREKQRSPRQQHSGKKLEPPEGRTAGGGGAHTASAPTASQPGTGNASPFTPVYGTYQSHVHPHPLRWTNVQSILEYRAGVGGYSCDNCHWNRVGFAWHCSECQFDLCPECWLGFLDSTPLTNDDFESGGPYFEPSTQPEIEERNRSSSNFFPRDQFLRLCVHRSRVVEMLTAALGDCNCVDSGREFFVSMIASLVRYGWYPWDHLSQPTQPWLLPAVSREALYEVIVPRILQGTADYLHHRQSLIQHAAQMVAAIDAKHASASSCGGSEGTARHQALWTPDEVGAVVFAMDSVFAESLPGSQLPHLLPLCVEAACDQQKYLVVDTVLQQTWDVVAEYFDLLSLTLSRLASGSLSDLYGIVTMSQGNFELLAVIGKVCRAINWRNSYINAANAKPTEERLHDHVKSLVSFAAPRDLQSMTLGRTDSESWLMEETTPLAARPHSRENLSFSAGPVVVEQQRSSGVKKSEILVEVLRRHKEGVKRQESTSRPGTANAAAAQQEAAREMEDPWNEQRAEEIASIVSFAQSNRTALNFLIASRNDPRATLDEGLDFLLNTSKILDFTIRLSAFRVKMQYLQENAQNSYELNVRRDALLRSTFDDVASFVTTTILSESSAVLTTVDVSFDGEEAMDAGGVKREWLTLVFQRLVQLFSAASESSVAVHSDNKGIGSLCQSNLDESFPPILLRAGNESSGAYELNPSVPLTEDTEQLTRLLGVIFGIAVSYDVPIDLHLSRATYAHMIGRQPNFRDLEATDPDLYKNLKFILEIATEEEMEAMCLVFTAPAATLGSPEVPLLPNGQDIPVTLSNRAEYVRKRADYRQTQQAAHLLIPFVEGFHFSMPIGFLQCFTAQDLELVSCGVSVIDVEDLRSNTVYEGYLPTSPQVRWFWESCSTMAQQDLVKLVQFATASTRPPAGGFSALNPRLTLVRCALSANLPVAHTCHNRIDLPEYETAVVLREKLMQALTLGNVGFALV